MHWVFIEPLVPQREKRNNYSVIKENDPLVFNQNHISNLFRFMLATASQWNFDLYLLHNQSILSGENLTLKETGVLERLGNSHVVKIVYS